MSAPPSWVPSDILERTDIYPDRDSWLAARNKGIMPVGGTTAAALLGVGWQSRWDLWATLHQPGYTSPPKDEASMAAGNYWEGPLTEWARVNVGEVWAPTCITTARGLDWARASLDGFVLYQGECCGLEIKTARYSDEWGRDGAVMATTEDPLAVLIGYAVQVWWYMWVTGLPRFVIVVGLGFQDVRRITIEAASTPPDLIRNIAAARSRYMVRGIAPEVDGSDECLRALLARTRDGVAEATPEQLATARAWAIARAARMDAEKTEKQAKAEAIAAMGDALTLEVPTDKKPRRMVWLTGSTLYHHKSLTETA